MDVDRFFRDFGIHFAGPGERHYRGGWVNIPCPFCVGHSGNHLGYSINNNYWSCHRCGGKSSFKVVQKLLGIPNNQVIDILCKYKGRSRKKQNSLGIEVRKTAFRVPDDLMPIRRSKTAMDYMLKERKHFSKIDIAWLEKKYGLQATGEAGLFQYKKDSKEDKLMDLSYRLFVPITFDYEIVTWQTRDLLSGNPKVKYIACPEQVEKIHHKSILYNQPDPYDHEIVVVCEGIFDVWKCALAGFPATCFFGVKYTPSQLKALMAYKKVIVLFDPDKAGDQSCKKLRRQLLFANKQVEFIQKMTEDPGDMSKAKLSKLLKPLFKFVS